MLVKERKPDLAILDIKLNFRKAAEDGVMLAKKLKNDYFIPIIFLSAHNDEETLLRIKSIDSQHFIVKTKPLNKEQKEQLYTSVQLGIPNDAEIDSKSVTNGNILGINATFEGKKLLISFDNILYIETHNDPRNTIKIHLEKEVHVLNEGSNGRKTVILTQTVFRYASLSKMAKVLPSHFLQIHESFTINLSKITAYTCDEVVVNESAILRGKTNKKELDEYLKTRFP